MSYTCPTHETVQSGFCERCMEDFRRRRPASGMTAEERAVALETLSPILTIPFGDLQQRIEELTGRPVFTHELGTGGLERLAVEVRSGQPASFGEVLDKIPPHVETIVVKMDD
jgi:hypothetical protein